MLGLRRAAIVGLSCLCVIIAALEDGCCGEVVEGDLGRRLDEYLTRIVPFGFSGAVLVARDGKVILNKGYGPAIRSEEIANTSETVFSTGSITKQFTAAAIMKLEMLGKLNTDDKIKRYLGGVPQDKVDITLHHLLTHTAGVLPSSGSDYTIAHRDTTVKKILDSPLEFTPGTRFSYSNAGYTLLAAIVEQVSGQPYEQFLNEQLFQPAGMKFTGYRMPDWDGRVVAHYYVGDTDNGTPLEREYPYWNLIGNGGILSTTDDMFKWHLALMGDGVLSEAAKAKLYTPFLNDYAYGWDVLESEHGTLIRHDGGSMLGNAAEIRRYVDAGVVTIVFCNADGEKVLFDGLRERIEHIVFGGEVWTPPAPVPLDPAELSKFAHVYNPESGGTFTVTEEGEGLRITPDGHGAMNVLAFPEFEDPSLLHNDLDERAYMLFDAVLRGDYGMFRVELRDEERTERFKQFIETRLEKHRGQTGKIRQVHVFGTLPGHAPGEVLTLVVLRGVSGGQVVFRLHWVQGELAGISATEAVEPVSMHLIPVSPTRFAGYNIGWGKGITIDFEVDRHNSVRSLTIPTAGEDIVAARR